MIPSPAFINRAKLEDTFKQWEEDPDYATKKASVFLLDLNNFKEINDTYYGHHHGDIVLKEPRKPSVRKPGKEIYFFERGPPRPTLPSMTKAKILN